MVCFVISQSMLSIVGGRFEPEKCVQGEQSAGPAPTREEVSKTKLSFL